MVEYKLYYFNFRSRAEVIRILFNYAEQPFEDIRFEPKDWPKFKPKAPFGQAPFLRIIDGEKKYCISQSLAIARYLAKKFELAGKCEIEAARVDMYTDQVNDLLNEHIKIVLEKDESRKKELDDKFNNEILPRNLGYFEERISNSKNGYLVNSGLTIADLYLFNVLDILSEKVIPHLSNFPGIKKHGREISSLPKIRAYLDKRPKTDL